MGRFIDLSGRRFGELNVVERAGYLGRQIGWRCRCDCGNETIVRGVDLSAGRTKSCGHGSLRALAERRQDLTGRQFGELTVIEYAGGHRTSGGNPQVLYQCRCSCGNEVIVRAGSLRSGNTRSCGHVRNSLAAERSRRHGASELPEYRVWKGMITRCENPRYVQYKHYGGRGIKICGEWRHDFPAFLAHIGPRPSSKHSIDRINNDGNYEPGNVRWATQDVQVNNGRRWAKHRMEIADGHNLCS